MRITLLPMALLACGGAAHSYAPPAPPEITLESTYDPASVRWSEGQGDNRIEGTALLRTVGGEPRTCAALDVGLIPWSRHAGERMAHLYGSIRSGYNPVAPRGRHPRWANDIPAFYESVRRTKCDAQGRFAFDGVPDGEWFVEAVVTWEAPRYRHIGGPQGGTLMQRVLVKGGTTERVVLAAD